jgi:hypothetical protein
MRLAASLASAPEEGMPKADGAPSMRGEAGFELAPGGVSGYKYEAENS